MPASLIPYGPLSIVAPPPRAVSAAAINRNFKTVADQLALKAPIADPALTGAVTVDTGSGNPFSVPSGNWAMIIDQHNNSSGANGLLIVNRWQASSSTVLEVGTANASSEVYSSALTVDGLGNLSFAAANIYALNVLRGYVGTSVPSSFNITSNNSAAAATDAVIANACDLSTCPGVTVGTIRTDSGAGTPILTASSGTTWTSKLVSGAGTSQFRVLTNGQLVSGAPAGVSTTDLDSNLLNNQMSFWLDESTTPPILRVRVRKSNGTIYSGAITLV